MEKRYKIRLKTGDKVIVLSGKYKGKTGKIARVHPKLNKVTVEGINIVKKHIKRTRDNAGGVVEITKPLWVSKVAIYNAETKKPSKIGYKLSTTGKKTRIYKSTGKEISNA
jgi:large subunit ribosomal protein L24